VKSAVKEEKAGLNTGTEPEPKVWFVYLVRTAGGVLYTGISTDPWRRLLEHESGRKGARNLRGKGPLQLVFAREAGDRSCASRLEARIKRMNRAQKLLLISGEADWPVLPG
jgi:putative endonuclease